MRGKKKEKGQGGNHEDSRIAMTEEGLTERTSTLISTLPTLVYVSCPTRELLLLN